MPTANETDIQAALEAAHAAHAASHLTASALDNLTAWLTEPRYAEYQQRVIAEIRQQRWQQLDDVFWTVIPFGTGGRRGRMYPVGSNAINDRTIGESAQGLADYVLEYHGGKAEGLSCAIAYDTRHNSRHFAELCASILAASGFTIYFLDDYRATPQLSFAVRYKGCSCGIMVTASHNPPSDNAVKVYWSSGAQVLPPHDKAIIQRVMQTQRITQMPFAEAVQRGLVKFVTDEVDQAYRQQAAAMASGGPRDAQILYSPLHGVGAAAVIPLLQEVGFNDVTVYAPHREPSGDFPNVPGHVSNPENTPVFDAPIEFAKAEGMDVVMATDPDCDRLGVAAPLTSDRSGPWATLTGNQIGALLCDFVLSRRRAANLLPASNYTVTTLVSSGMVRQISQAYGIRCFDDLLVGFKYIAEVIDREGPDDFAFGCEESHGYLVGTYARDKDGAVACLLMSELIAELVAQKKTLHDRMEELYLRHGRHLEYTINVMMEGSEGMAAMKRLMAAFRERPPVQLGGLKVVGVRDYLQKVERFPGGKSQPLAGPTGDLVMLDLEEPGNVVAVRPSGTEPKVKFYVLTRLSPEASAHAALARSQLDERIKTLEADVRAFAKGI